MNIYEYTAINNPLGAKKIINHYGQQAIRRPDILARQLASCVAKNGKQALLMMCEVHPDYELIREYTEYQAKKEAEDLRLKNPFSSIEGKEIIESVKELKNKAVAPLTGAENGKNEKTELLIIGGVILVSLALITKK
tara:strand:- start:2327 stop:2737 length:411 start_codon:yes stop_codon:yes gene_type:complete